MQCARINAHVELGGCYQFFELLNAEAVQHVDETRVMVKSKLLRRSNLHNF